MWTSSVSETEVQGVGFFEQSAWTDCLRSDGTLTVSVVGEGARKFFDLLVDAEVVDAINYIRQRK